MIRKTPSRRYSHRTIQGVRVSIDADWRVTVVDDAGLGLLTLGTVRLAPGAAGREWVVRPELEGVDWDVKFCATQREGIEALLAETAWKPREDPQPRSGTGARWVDRDDRRTPEPPSEPNAPGLKISAHHDARATGPFYEEIVNVSWPLDSERRAEYQWTLERGFEDGEWTCIQNGTTEPAQPVSAELAHRLDSLVEAYFTRQELMEAADARMGDPNP